MKISKDLMGRALEKITAPSAESEGPTQSVEPQDSLAESLIEQVWERTAEIYGHKWTSHYGDTDQNGTWGKALAGMSLEDINRGFVACLERDDPWPPTLPEFRGLCKPKKVGARDSWSVPASRQLAHRLSVEERARGRACIRDLKEMLK